MLNVLTEERLAARYFSGKPLTANVVKPLAVCLIGAICSFLGMLELSTVLLENQHQKTDNHEKPNQKYNTCRTSEEF